MSELVSDFFVVSQFFFKITCGGAVTKHIKRAVGKAQQDLLHVLNRECLGHKFAAKLHRNCLSCTAQRYLVACMGGDYKVMPLVYGVQNKARHTGIVYCTDKICAADAHSRMWRNEFEGIRIAFYYLTADGAHGAHGKVNNKAWRFFCAKGEILNGHDCLRTQRRSASVGKGYLYGRIRSFNSVGLKEGVPLCEGDILPLACNKNRTLCLRYNSSLCHVTTPCG